MNELGQSGLASTALALGVIAVAFLLTWRQRADSGAPRIIGGELDRKHFERQDRRRFRGSVILAIIGLGIGVGGRIDIRVGPTERVAFLAVWGVVFLLLLQLLAMAFVDLWTTRRYAKRQRRMLAEERRKALEAEVDTLRDRSRRDDR